ncbi:hypothetical protein EDB82DRAFT_497164 [Fusarium venenatum]|uniref:uncharacterized protein n=1 Tax=Fusarium venenatum TaxID=56646 RepID=UPI001DA08983|nr:hypothetical protein EDB82DRAFT_497164 [Fusarium venenatum]
MHVQTEPSHFQANAVNSFWCRTRAVLFQVSTVSVVLTVGLSVVSFNIIPPLKVMDAVNSPEFIIARAQFENRRAPTYWPPLLCSLQTSFAERMSKVLYVYFFFFFFFFGVTSTKAA